ncbi:oxidoreductase [Rhodococcus wratislaviensis]|uniref:Putative oxidoreductase n=1 Tax=Rhodococcus wratislaviensis NBRC 100605 TaxID=1219028 RepID=X0PW49_RHOWR|nr:oxidoreductase [Rhodococcus wratislaviensis]GAF47488.1 putative oxidoreductase [Rhodococcus wratislaviensis NBRC 100605]
MRDRPFTWSTADIPDQTGRTHVVTGASSGLGLETTRRLLDAGATVVAAVRSPDKARAALADHPRADHLDVRRLDLADLDSVRTFSNDLARDHSHLDVLVANAGLWTRTRELNPEGVELTLATNHLGHYALTGLLLPLLAQGTDARVVIVSSNLYRAGKVGPALDDLAGSADWSQNKAYATSKTANLLFAAELDRRLHAHGSPVRSVAVHPGMTSTPLHSNAPVIQRAVVAAVALLLSRPAATGALPLLYGATSPDVRTDRFLGFGLLGRDNRLRHQPVRNPAGDRELATRLWKSSEELTGVHFPTTTTHSMDGCEFRSGGAGYTLSRTRVDTQSAPIVQTTD